MNIKRYDFGTKYTGSTGMPDIVEKVDGKYMLVSDHKALDEKYTDLLIQSLDQAKTIKRLNDELEGIGAGGVSMMGDTEAVTLRAALAGAVDLAEAAYEYWNSDKEMKVGKILLAMSGRLPRYDRRADAIQAALTQQEQV